MVSASSEQSILFKSFINPNAKSSPTFLAKPTPANFSSKAVLLEKQSITTNSKIYLSLISFCL